jgi:bacillithiol biosynthesis cysteine-adding enzyme BshC
MSSAFAPAFLRGEARAHAFLPDDFRHASRRAEQVRQAGARAVSAQTLSALRAQAAWLAPSPRRDEQRAALGQPGTVVVVTGQQVGLFLGPLYALYKAATAVVLARALQAETGVRCVPVFWLQGEDHDFEEIDHCDVNGREGAAVRLRLAAPHRVERSSLSGLALGEGVEDALQSLAAALEGLPHADEVLALFRRHYGPHRTWVHAFAGVMAELFDELVFVDPRDEALASQALPLHRRALEEARAIAALLLERQAALERAGFTAQVHVRPDAPLSFFHPEGRDGPRYRLEPRGDGWGLVGAPSGTPGLSRAGSDLSDALAKDPLCVSTSALLRPLYQDTLLPTAAVVGGPGEANYFAQLAPLYAHFGLPMPMFVPRARFRVLDARTQSLLSALGLNASEVEVPSETLLQRLLPPPPSLPPAELERRLIEAVEPLLASVPVTPGSDVEDAVQRTRKTLSRAASRLAGRCARERLRADAVLTARVERLQRALYPNGEPQERVLGLAGFAARFGMANFTARVLSHVDPFEVTVKDLVP